MNCDVSEGRITWCQSGVMETKPCDHPHFQCFNEVLINKTLPIENTSARGVASPLISLRVEASE